MKKFLIGTGIATGIAILATAFIAGAQTAISTTPKSGTAMSHRMVLQVGPEGRVLLRGTIDSVSSSSLAVKSWGGDWMVNVGSATQVLPAAANRDLTQFKSGDFVGVQGTVDQGASWTINATLVRDWTYRQAINQERRQNIQLGQETIKNGASQNFQGAASNVSGSSFTLTVKGVVDTVNVASGAVVVNNNWLKIQLSSIKDGDAVSVWGVNASGTITAQIVRDISISAAGAAH